MEDFIKILENCLQQCKLSRELSNDRRVFLTEIGDCTNRPAEMRDHLPALLPFCVELYVLYDRKYENIGCAKLLRKFEIPNKFE
jgi:hypothetical protein